MQKLRKMNAFYRRADGTDRMSAWLISCLPQIVDCSQVIFRSSAVKHPSRHSQPGHPERIHQSGFTLIELLVTVAIFSILVALAVPSFGSFLSQWRVNSGTRSLVEDLQLARSEAIKTSRNVIVCPTVDGTSCKASSNDWSTGWLVFVDFNGDDSYKSSDGDRLLSVSSGATGVQSMVSDEDTWPTFMPNGLMGSGKSVTFTVTPTNSDAKVNKLKLNQIGRVTVTVG